MKMSQIGTAMLVGLMLGTANAVLPHGKVNGNEDANTSEEVKSAREKIEMLEDIRADVQISETKNGKEVEKLIRKRTKNLSRYEKIEWAKHILRMSPYAFAVWMNIERPTAEEAKGIYDYVVKLRTAFKFEPKTEIEIILDRRLGDSMEVLRRYRDDKGRQAVDQESPAELVKRLKSCAE